MSAKDFLTLSVPLGEAIPPAMDFVAKFILGRGDKSRLHEEVAAIVANPSEAVKKLKTTKIRLRKSLIINGRILWFKAFCQFFHSFSAFTDDPLRGEFAKALLKAPRPPQVEPVK